jgi:hypothetical protein
MMRLDVRTVVGALAGIVGVIAWAVALAVYQPFMEPHGSWIGPGEVAYPELASNNTYWPREVRHLGILLVLGALALVCRARSHGFAVGGLAVAGWLGVDVLLDRFDVHGVATAVWLSAAGVTVFAVLTLAVRRLAGRDLSGLAQHLIVTVAAVLPVVTTFVTTPWDEPVTGPAKVRIELAVSVLKTGLIVAFAAVALALVAGRLTRATAWRTAALAAVTAALGVPAAITYGPVAALTLFGMPVAAMLTVAATRPVGPARLLGAAAAGLVALLPALLVLYLLGTWIGAGLTALAGNPAVNGADSDLSLAGVGILLGLLLGAVGHVITSAPSAVAADPPREPAPLS